MFLGFLKNRAVLTTATLFFLVVCLAATVTQISLPVSFTESVNINMMVWDNHAIVYTCILLFVALLLVGLTDEFGAESEKHGAEFYALMLFGIVGGVMMVSYENLIMLFIGLEILSIAMYILAGSNKRNLASNEAALKYFLMGAFASGFLLFGIALIYGATASFELTGIQAHLAVLNGQTDTLLIAGVLFVLVGMLFKLAAAPFHFWTPDVYEGSPTLFTAFMGTIVKAAGIAALYRLLGSMAEEGYAIWWKTVVGVIALTLVIANITATKQDSFKRVMAWSSISHAGYLLIGLLAFNNEGEEAVVFYILAYSIANITAFGVLHAVTRGSDNFRFDRFNGMAKSHPMLALAMLIAMCSLAGIPLTAGFFGKLFLILAAFKNGGFDWLLVVAILMSAVGIYYYFRVVIAMYFKEPLAYAAEEKTEVKLTPLYALTLIITSGLTLLLGVWPGIIANVY